MIGTDTFKCGKFNQLLIFSTCVALPRSYTILRAVLKIIMAVAWLHAI